MNDYLTQVPLIRDLSHLVEWLLLVNAILTGAVILLAFRLTHYKHKAEETEAELNKTIALAVSRESNDPPLKKR